MNAAHPSDHLSFRERLATAIKPHCGRKPHPRSPEALDGQWLIKGSFTQITDNVHRAKQI
jgi:hypothetical protein